MVLFIFIFCMYFYVFEISFLGFVASAIGGTEGPDRIFVGGLPYYFTEEQIRELLQAFGLGYHELIDMIL